MLAEDKGACLAGRDAERQVAETDGPFARVDGQTAQPWDVGRAVEALSRLWNTPQQDTEGRLAANLTRLVESPSVSEIVGTSANGSCFVDCVEEVPSPPVP
jgi:hypothetical protein